MRIAIVNDMKMAVEVLRRAVLSRNGWEIAWTATTGTEAVQRCLQDTPDLILMDLIMPGLSGVEATRQIMTRCPCAILIVTASVGSQPDLVFQALGAGALDAVKTPSPGHSQEQLQADPILKKISTVQKLIEPATAFPTTKYQPPDEKDSECCPLVAVGASSGGPQALARLLAKLPANLPAAVVLVQHIDGEFVQGLVEWLDRQTPLPVKLATRHTRPRPGQVWVAGSEGNLVATRERTLTYCTKPSPRLNRPSIDTLFESLAQHWPARIIAALLTGMGSDGAQGLLALRQAGHHTIAQNKESSVIFSMPDSAIKRGAACEVLALEQIAPAIVRRLEKNVRL